jgi:hypothetical protein
MFASSGHYGTPPPVVRETLFLRIKRVKTVCSP